MKIRGHIIRVCIPYATCIRNVCFRKIRELADRYIKTDRDFKVVIYFFKNMCTKNYVNKPWKRKYVLISFVVYILWKWFE